MIKDSLVGKRQAITLKKLGFHEKTVYYFYHKKGRGINFAAKERTLAKYIVPIPTVDEAIDWLRRKHNIIIYNRIEPFVDPENETHKDILFRFSVKRCDVHHIGWNGRSYIGETRMSTTIYSLKREAIGIALTYIKEYGRNKKSTKSTKKE